MYVSILNILQMRYVNMDVRNSRMKVTIDIPDNIIVELEYEAEEIDMNLEDYLIWLIKNSWK